MANKFQNMSDGSALLKNVYRGPIIELLNAEIPVLRAAEKVKDAYSGLQVIRMVRTRRNQGIGAGSDGGTLPKIGRTTSTQATIAAKFNWLRFGITAGMIKASQTDAGSFARSYAFELKSAYNDLKTDLNRQFCHDGSGGMALVNTTSNASNVLVIKGRTTGEQALKYVDVDTTFDVVRSNAVVASGITVSSISSGTPSSTTATLILDQAISTVAGDTLVRSGSWSGAASLEISGLFYALDGATSTVYGIDRSSAIAYQGNYTDASTLASAQLSLSMMQSAFNEGLRRGNVGKYNAFFTDFSTLGMYQKLLTPDKRYANTKEGDGSFGNKGEFYLEFNGVPIVPDKDMPTKILMLPSEVLKLYVLNELEVAEETGSAYIAQSDSDSFETRLRYWCNLFNEQPAACAAIVSYTSP